MDLLYIYKILKIYYKNCQGCGGLPLLLLLLLFLLLLFFFFCTLRKWRIMSLPAQWHCRLVQSFGRLTTTHRHSMSKAPSLSGLKFSAEGRACAHNKYVLPLSGTCEVMCMRLRRNFNATLFNADLESNTNAMAFHFRKRTCEENHTHCTVRVSGYVCFRFFVFYRKAGNRNSDHFKTWNSTNTPLSTSGTLTSPEQWVGVLEHTTKTIDESVKGQIPKAYLCLFWSLRTLCANSLSESER